MNFIGFWIIRHRIFNGKFSLQCQNIIKYQKDLILKIHNFSVIHRQDISYAPKCSALNYIRQLDRLMWAFA